MTFHFYIQFIPVVCVLFVFLLYIYIYYFLVTKIENRF